MDALTATTRLMMEAIERAAKPEPDAAFTCPICHDRNAWANEARTSCIFCEEE